MTALTLADKYPFVAAMRERPDDDAPRLVYADFLEENGEDERAEFIRVQCEIEKTGTCEWIDLGDDCKLFNAKRSEYRLLMYCGTCARRKTLTEQASRIFNRHLCRWEDGRVMPHAAYRISQDYCSDNSDEPDTILLFRRGLISQVRCSLVKFIEHGPRIACEHPVTNWVITDGRDSLFGYGWDLTFPTIPTQDYSRERIHFMSTWVATLKQTSDFEKFQKFKTKFFCKYAEREADRLMSVTMLH